MIENLDELLQGHTHKLGEHEDGKVIDINRPHLTCDVCGRRHEENPYMVGTKTLCASCFWDWLDSVRIDKRKDRPE